MSKSLITKMDQLARPRISKNFFLRDFNSETAVANGINNIPDDFTLAVKAISKDGVEREYYRAMPPSRYYAACESILNVNR